MIVIQHRVNTVEALRQVPPRYGVEIDVRGHGRELLLGHDPILDPGSHERLEDYLRQYAHRCLVFNLKDTGHEERVIDLARQYGIEEYFLLDVSAPYLYEATRVRRFRKLAVRFSEIEPLEAVERYLDGGRPLLDWVWVDTFTTLPLDAAAVATLRQFRTCLVCPERWGRPQDIPVYLETLARLDFRLDAVMTAGSYARQWESGTAP